MSKLHILCVGRRARDPLLEAADDYLARLQKQSKVELTRLRESDPISEGDAIIARVRPSDHVVALDERGISMTSRALSSSLEQWQRQGRNVVFVVGGANGLSRAVTDRAQLVLTLSAMTMPHRLALVVLLEQLYRAQSIAQGSPYHRD